MLAAAGLPRASCPTCAATAPTRFLSTPTRRARGEQAALGSDLLAPAGRAGDPARGAGRLRLGRPRGLRGGGAVAGALRRASSPATATTSRTSPRPCEPADAGAASTGSGTSTTSTASAAGPGCERTGAASPGCCGGCGRRTGASTTRPSSAAPRAFDNPDFVDVVIQSYRHRFGCVPGDPALEAIEARLAAQPAIAVPTIALARRRRRRRAAGGVASATRATSPGPTSGASCRWRATTCRRKRRRRSRGRCWTCPRRDARGAAPAGRARAPAARRCTSARTTPGRGGSRRVVNQCSGGLRPAERVPGQAAQHRLGRGRQALRDGEAVERRPTRRPSSARPTTGCSRRRRARSRRGASAHQRPHHAPVGVVGQRQARTAGPPPARRRRTGA